MKKILVLLPFLFIVLSASAQSHSRESNDSIAKLVVKYINEQSSDKIHALMSEKAKKKVSAQYLNTVFTTSYFPYGKIKETSFKSFDKASGIGKYKIVYTYASTSFSMSLQLNNQHKIDELNFLPYKGRSVSKK